MTGERCPHCHGIVAPARRGGDPMAAWRVHEESEHPAGPAMTATCEHCLALRAILEATNAELGRPVDSFDHDRHGLPRSAFPSKADVAGCDCRCHSHLRIVGAGP